MVPVQINFFHVLVAAIAAMIVGAVWYSPALFSKRWMKLTGNTDMKAGGGNAARGYVLTGIGSLLMAYVLTYVIELAQVESIGHGLVIGFLLWLGFVAPALAATHVFENKPRDLYLINVGYQLAAILVMSAILAVWL